MQRDQSNPYHVPLFIRPPFQLPITHPAPVFASPAEHAMSVPNQSLMPSTWTPAAYSYQRTSPLTPRKRQHPDQNLNLPVHFPESPTRPSPPKKKRTSPRSWQDKLHEVLDKLDELGWSLATFLYYFFCLRDKKNVPVRRSHRHAATLQHFLRGKTKTTPSFILDAWLRNAYGRVTPGSEEAKLMYSTTVDFRDIKSVRPALTSFAVQLAQTQLCVESRGALRVSSSTSTPPHLQWGDVGSDTIATVTAVIKETQPLLLNFIASYALQKAVRTSTDIPDRKRRPLDAVCTHLVSTINHVAAPRLPSSRLVPTLRGLYYFAESVPYDIFAFSSRIAHTPSYSTIYRLLAKLSDQEAKITRDVGRDPLKSGVLRLDNVQNYLLQRDPRIGRENKMNIGIAATYFEGHNVNPKAFDLADKRQRLAENKRRELTTEQLAQWIDGDHLELVLSLQWLDVLAKYVPQLHGIRKHVAHLYRTSAAKTRLPVRRTELHPLATSSKNETVTTELKDALLDFFGQIGQSSTNHNGRLLLVGGDGLTFEKIIQLKRYLQFHDDPFESGELIEPLLEWWHLQWTDLSRIFETHWGGSLVRDPSTLGHSATKIGRSKPPNLKKVDYYPSLELAYLVLDVRMLDCWRIYFQTDDLFRHFKELDSQGNLPSLDTLCTAAKSLYRAYSSTYGAQRAFADVKKPSHWTSLVPEGSAWDRDPDNERVTNRVLTTTKVPARGKKMGIDDEAHEFHGDQSLAQSITYMRDMAVSREMALAVAEGDAGRVYEMVKHMLFTFAGSSHHKYTTYLLETICNLELECSPELRHEILNQSLVNLTGQAGAFCPGDLIQEYFNRLLQAIVERKGTDYGDVYVRQVIARNLHHLARIKLDVRLGEGLAKRSGRHTAPHTRPEVRILLEEYQRKELHLRRPGRRYDKAGNQSDDFTQGYESLHSGKLERWVMQTTFYRNIGTATKGMPQIGLEHETDAEELIEDGNGHAGDQGISFGLMTLIDGEMELVEVDPTLDATKLGELIHDTSESYEEEEITMDIGGVDTMSDGEEL